MASATKVKLTMRAWNQAGHRSDVAARTWAATLYHADGSLAPFRRLLGVDFGQTGTRKYAVAEAREAADTLRAKGYDVDLVLE